MAVTQASRGGVYKLTAANDTISGFMAVHKVRWVGATAAHVCELRTGAYGANDIVFHDIAVNASHECDFSGSPLNLDGLKVQALGSGTLYVYIM